MRKNRLILSICIIILVAGALNPYFGVPKILAAKSTQEQIRDKQKEQNDLKNKLDDQKDDIHDMLERQLANKGTTATTTDGAGGAQGGAEGGAGEAGGATHADEGAERTSAASSLLWASLPVYSR